MLNFFLLISLLLTCHECLFSASPDPSSYDKERKKLETEIRILAIMSQEDTTTDLCSTTDTPQEDVLSGESDTYDKKNNILQQPHQTQKLSEGLNAGADQAEKTKQKETFAPLPNFKLEEINQLKMLFPEIEKIQLIEQKIDEMMPTKVTPLEYINAYLKAADTKKDVLATLSYISQEASHQDQCIDQKNKKQIARAIVESEATLEAVEKVFALIQPVLDQFVTVQYEDCSKISIAALLYKKSSSHNELVSLARDIKKLRRSLAQINKQISRDEKTLNSWFSWQNQDKLKKEITDARALLEIQETELAKLLTQAYTTVKEQEQLERAELLFLSSNKEYQLLLKGQSSRIKNNRLLQELHALQDPNPGMLERFIRFPSAIFQENLKADESWSLEEELLDQNCTLRNSQDIVARAHERMILYLEDWKDLHSDHSWYSYEHFKEFYEDTKKLRVQVETHLNELGAYIIDNRHDLIAADGYRCLMNLRDSLLEDQVFCEQALKYNVELYNAYEKWANKTGGKGLKAGFFIFNFLNGVKQSLKADGQKHQDELQRGMQIERSDHNLCSQRQPNAIATLKNSILDSKSKEQNAAFSSQERIARILPESAPMPLFGLLSYCQKGLNDVALSHNRQVQSLPATSSGASATDDQQSVLREKINNCLDKLTSETYVDHCKRFNGAEIQPFSFLEYYEYKLKVSALSRGTESGKLAFYQQLLSGAGQSLAEKTKDLAINTAAGVPIGLMTSVALSATVPEFMLAYNLVSNICNTCANTEALVQDFDKLCTAVQNREYYEVGQNLVKTTVSAVLVAQGSKALYTQAQDAFQNGCLPSFINGLKASIKDNKGTRNNKPAQAKIAEEKRQQKLTGQFGDNLPAFIREKRAPLDHETILAKKDFLRTTYKGISKIKGAQIYTKDGLYYYRDTQHIDLAAHLEVFDKTGKIHLGEADIVTGILKPGTADRTKSMKG